jgi:hypothetical protein
MSQQPETTTEEALITSLHPCASLTLTYVNGRGWGASIGGVCVVRIEPSYRVTRALAQGATAQAAINALWQLISAIPPGGYLLVEQGRYGETKKRWNPTDDEWDSIS